MAKKKMGWAQFGDRDQLLWWTISPTREGCRLAGLRRGGSNKPVRVRVTPVEAKKTAPKGRS